VERATAECFSLSQTGWPDLIVKRSPKMWPTHFFVHIYTQLLPLQKKPKYLGYFCNFRKTAKSNQWPMRLKFTQSGHHSLKSTEFDWRSWKSRLCRHRSLLGQAPKSTFGNVAIDVFVLEKKEAVKYINFKVFLPKFRFPNVTMSKYKSPTSK
jgi:hypothetical protein